MRMKEGKNEKKKEKFATKIEKIMTEKDGS